MIKTRLDIAFATSIVSRFAKNLNLEYFNTLNQILRYLVRSAEKVITFGEDK